MARWLSVLACITAACTYYEDDECIPNSTLSVRVSPSKASGTVSTSGACTEVECVEPVPDGCTLWRGEITSGDLDARCRVVLRVGERIERAVVGGNMRCGAPQGENVSF